VCLVTLLSEGCGKKGPPLPPIRSVPEKVGRFSIRQVGDHLVLSFPRPTSRIGGAPLEADARVELLMTLRDPVPRRAREIELDPSLTWTIPSSEWKIYEQGRRLEVGLTLGRIAQGLELPGGAAALKGRKLSFIIDVIDKKRMRSDPSGIETFAVCDPPVAPEASAARVTEEGLLLTWRPGPDGASRPALPGVPAETQFNIYRQAEGDPFPESAVRTSTFETRFWLDVDAAVGQPYRYVIRAAGATGRCESADGPVVAASRVDLFPPSPPQGLAAVAEEGTIHLFWRPNREADLRGYRVYRADGPDRPFRLLTPEDLTTTSYTDESVSPGVTYSYAVTGRDGATPPNESSFSDHAIEVMKAGRKVVTP
jgi:hypothetical protein